MALKLARDRRGATSIELGLVVALVAVALLGALAALGDALNTTYGQVSCSVTADSAARQSQPNCQPAPQPGSGPPPSVL